CGRAAPGNRGCAGGSVDAGRGGCFRMHRTARGARAAASVPPTALRIVPALPEVAARFAAAGRGAPALAGDRGGRPPRVRARCDQGPSRTGSGSRPAARPGPHRRRRARGGTCASRRGHRALGGLEGNLDRRIAHGLPSAPRRAPAGRERMDAAHRAAILRRAGLDAPLDDLDDKTAMDEAGTAYALADALSASARDLERDLEWLGRVIDARVHAYFGMSASGIDPLSIAPPPIADARSPYAAFLREHALTAPARLVVILALAPHLRPQLLDVFWSRNDLTQRGFTEFGGLQGTSHGGFVPTAETALFLLAGDDLAARLSMARLFDPGHLLARADAVRV